MICLSMPQPKMELCVGLKMRLESIGDRTICRLLQCQCMSIGRIHAETDLVSVAALLRYDVGFGKPHAQSCHVRRLGG